MKWSKEQITFYLGYIGIMMLIALALVLLSGCEDENNYYNVFGIEINEELNMEQDSLFLFNGANQDTSRT